MTTQIIQSDHGQVVKLPAGFEFDETEVTIRREGNLVVLEPIKPKKWPAGFFERIRINDPKFERPPQGNMPPAPDFDAQ